MDANKDIWRQYYGKALGRKHAPKTELALKLNTTGLHVAVDCGCGTGSDIAYMAEQGYLVQGFDMNPDAVAICHERNEQGSTALGRMKHWHTYTVVAVRRV
ncbi:methyltransferase domain-containing protein [Salinispirillum marinum]|uniref:Methyltransferase domain-containing protein n=2 Tax=Saccharospirillaceae TaxID=255527 RepID=A0ABV8BEW0_9GAMM